MQISDVGRFLKIDVRHIGRIKHQDLKRSSSPGGSHEGKMKDRLKKRETGNILEEYFFFGGLR